MPVGTTVLRRVLPPLPGLFAALAVLVLVAAVGGGLTGPGETLMQPASGGSVTLRGVPGADMPTSTTSLANARDDALRIKLIEAGDPRSSVRSITPGLAAKGVANPVPQQVARVVETRVAGRAQRLGPPGASDVFVTSADDIAGMSSAQIAKRLALYDDAGRLRSGPFSVFEFDTPAGIASPVFRTTPGFVGRGRTAGGATEFVVPNQWLSELQNLRTWTAP